MTQTAPIGSAAHKEWSVKMRSLRQLPKAELVRRVRQLGFIDAPLARIDQWSKDELLAELLPLPRIDTTELDEHVRTLEEFASSAPLEHQDTRQEAEGEGR